MKFDPVDSGRFLSAQVDENGWRKGEMKTTMKMATVVLFGSLVLNAVAVDPTISDVVVRQRWPWSRLVDINYVLTCDTTSRVDIALTAYNSVSRLTLPSASLSGDLFGVEQGARRIVWDPTKTAYTNEILTQFQVGITPSVIPSYMVVDLTTGDISYRYDWGELWSDVTNHEEFLTTKLVLKRINPGTFMMGSPTNEVGRRTTEDLHEVKLTKRFYIGVFETTQQQWEELMSDQRSYPSFFTNDTCRATRPVEAVSYYDIREKTDSAATLVDGGSGISPTWPATNAVWADSFMGRLRTKTGLNGFDLPTEAQWEYACRAGTVTAFSDGREVGNNNLSALTRYSYNNGGTGSTDRNVDTSMGTARDGTYLPNPWGLYDMHGNIAEWVLDYWQANLGFTSVCDPVGPSSGTARVVKGGNRTDGPNLCRSAMRADKSINRRSSGVFGFRVALNVDE